VRQGATAGPAYRWIDQARFGQSAKFQFKKIASLV
jgi:hypothetical protein